MAYLLIVPLYAMTLAIALGASLILLSRGGSRRVGVDLLCGTLGSLAGFLVANIPMVAAMVVWVRKPDPDSGMVTFLFFIGPLVFSVLGTVVGVFLGLKVGRRRIPVGTENIVANRMLRAVRFALVAGVLGMAFFIALDFVMWFIPPSLGWGPWKWSSTGPVQTTSAFAVALLTRSTHPVLAEYDQRLEIYATGPERRGSLGRINLDANTGGQTRVLLYAEDENGRPAARLVDRFGETVIDLSGVKVADASVVAARWTFVGTFANGPPRFVPSSVWPESLARMEAK